MYIRNGPLIYSEIYTEAHRWVVKRARVFLCHCICMYTYVWQQSPRLRMSRRGDAEYVHWTLTRKRRRRGRFVLGLRQQVDKLRGVYSTPWRTNERKVCFLKNIHCHPSSGHDVSRSLMIFSPFLRLSLLENASSFCTKKLEQCPCNKFMTIAANFRTVLLIVGANCINDHFELINFGLFNFLPPSA